MFLEALLAPMDQTLLSVQQPPRVVAWVEARHHPRVTQPVATVVLAAAGAEVVPEVQVSLVKVTPGAMTQHMAWAAAAAALARWVAMELLLLVAQAAQEQMLTQRGPLQPEQVPAAITAVEVVVVLRAQAAQHLLAALAEAALAAFTLADQPPTEQTDQQIPVVARAVAQAMPTGLLVVRES